MVEAFFLDYIWQATLKTNSSYIIGCATPKTNTNSKDNPKDKLKDNKSNFWTSKTNLKTDLRTNPKVAMILLTKRILALAHFEIRVPEVDHPLSLLILEASVDDLGLVLSSASWFLISILKHIFSVWSCLFDLIALLEKRVLQHLVPLARVILSPPPSPTASASSLSPGGICSSLLSCLVTGPITPNQRIFSKGIHGNTCNCNKCAPPQDTCWKFELISTSSLGYWGFWRHESRDTLLKTNLQPPDPVCYLSIGSPRIACVFCFLPRGGSFLTFFLGCAGISGSSFEAKPRASATSSISITGCVASTLCVSAT